MSGYFNPRPPRGGGDGGQLLLAGDGSGISIHAPREGGDIAVQGGQDLQRPISIHAPREGGDSAPPPRPCGPWYFNPRPPRGGGRQHGWPKSRRQANFNPRPPRGGRRYCILSCGRFMLPFQSTPPARGATPAFRPKGQTGGISIHAPREGGDNNHGTIFTGALQNFNPRPPRGGRLRRSL